MIDEDVTVVSRLDTRGRGAGGQACNGRTGGRRCLIRRPDDESLGPFDRLAGSSADPGSATAAGLVAFSIGTETLGSILAPFGICSVTGLRPTFGRVSRHGAITLSWTLDKVGPMCRAVEDCALVLMAIQGSEGQDLSVQDVQLGCGQAPRRLSKGRFSNTGQAAQTDAKDAAAL